MEPTFFAQYKGFEFHCSPVRLRGGGFIPRLLVSAHYGASEIDVPVPVQGPPYVDATEAAHRSFWAGPPLGRQRCGRPGADASQSLAFSAGLSRRPTPPPRPGTAPLSDRSGSRPARPGAIVHRGHGFPASGVAMAFRTLLYRYFFFGWLFRDVTSRQPVRARRRVAPQPGAGPLAADLHAALVRLRADAVCGRRLRRAGDRRTARVGVPLRAGRAQRTDQRRHRRRMGRPEGAILRTGHANGGFSPAPAARASRAARRAASRPPGAPPIRRPRPARTRTPRRPPSRGGPCQRAYLPILRSDRERPLKLALEHRGQARGPPKLGQAPTGTCRPGRAPRSGAPPRSRTAGRCASNARMRSGRPVSVASS